MGRWAERGPIYIAATGGRNVVWLLSPLQNARCLPGTATDRRQITATARTLLHGQTLLGAGVLQALTAHLPSSRPPAFLSSTCRLQTGMRGAFGKPQGKVARVSIGDPIISIRVADKNEKHVVEGLRRYDRLTAAHPRPCLCCHARPSYLCHVSAQSALLPGLHLHPGLRCAAAACHSRAAVPSSVAPPLSLTYRLSTLLCK